MDWVEIMTTFYGGSDEAFDALEDYWFRRLFAFFRRCGASPEQAEDLAQEVLYRVCRTRATGRGRFDPARASFAAWLFTIAANLLRDAGGSPSVPDGPVPVEEAADPKPGPEDYALAAERRQAVRDCLASLPESFRAPLTLWMEGLAYEEIANTLGILPGDAGSIVVTTVTNRLHRARQQMRRCLESKGLP